MNLLPDRATLAVLLVFLFCFLRFLLCKILVQLGLLLIAKGKLVVLQFGLVVECDCLPLEVAGLLNADGGVLRGTGTRDTFKRR